MYGRSAPSREPRGGAPGSARRPRPGRCDASHGVCAVRTGGHLYAAGVLPRHRHPGLRRRDQRLVVALGALPARHPLARLLHDAPDFRQEAALADALLHPQDRAFSVPQLLDFIGSAGLTFSRWVRQAPYSPHCGVMARLPQASRIAALEPAQQCAAAELFRGTMMSHSVIVRRDDRPGRSQAISFSGDAWLDYVPVRVPDTICVQSGCRRALRRS